MRTGHRPRERSAESRARGRELRELAWALLLIDGIALGVGLLAERHVEGAAWIGVVLAGWVTVAFVMLVGANLAALSLARVWRRLTRGDR